VHERHPVDPELEEPLATSSAGRRGDRDRLDLAGADALAQRPSGYDAFSTLTPVMMRPSRRSAAAPTWYLEYGA
jgi:hypothetical protein